MTFRRFQALFASTACVGVPKDGGNERYIFWFDFQPSDTVAIWGCSPVRLFAIQSALALGA